MNISDQERWSWGGATEFNHQMNVHVQCVPDKRKPVNQVNFSEKCNDLSEKVYIVTKFSLSSFF